MAPARFRCGLHRSQRQDRLAPIPYVRREILVRGATIVNIGRLATATLTLATEEPPAVPPARRVARHRRDDIRTDPQKQRRAGLEKMT